jgi:hypothetical protein
VELYVQALVSFHEAVLEEQATFTAGYEIKGLEILSGRKEYIYIYIYNCKNRPTLQVEVFWVVTPCSILV